METVVRNILAVRVVLLVSFADPVCFSSDNFPPIRPNLASIARVDCPPYPYSFRDPHPYGFHLRCFF
jgi:hypothetical protein